MKKRDRELYNFITELCLYNIQVDRSKLLSSFGRIRSLSPIIYTWRDKSEKNKIKIEFICLGEYTTVKGTERKKKKKVQDLSI